MDGAISAGEFGLAIATLHDLYVEMTGAEVYLGRDAGGRHTFTGGVVTGDRNALLRMEALYTEAFRDHIRTCSGCDIGLI